MEKITPKIPVGSQNLNKQRNTLSSHVEITTATTRLWVTSSWYLRWRWIAKNLSTLMATTPNRTPEKTNIKRWKKPCRRYSRDCWAVTTWPKLRCKVVGPVNQHQHQKQQDSGAMFLKVLATTKFFVWRGLLQCSTWWRYRIENCWRHN